MRLALATCLRLPEPDTDQDAVVAAFTAAGIETSVLAWDDPDAPFDTQDLVVLRSTWNYFQRVSDFLAWADRIGAATTLLNPARIVRWNAVKTYLADLERRGIPTVPTEFVSRGASRRIDEIVKARGWTDVVVKPAVSAGSFRTQRFPDVTGASADAAQAFLADLAKDRDAMVQQWMPSVDTYGERSLVWIDGTITHAIRKTPRFADGVEQVSDAMEIADDERAFAEAALAPFASDLLYARVDMVREESGSLRIMELELIEPSLFFAQAPHALERFVAAVARRRETA